MKIRYKMTEGERRNTKKEIYEKDRERIVEMLDGILRMEENDRKFTVEEVDKDEERKEKIKEIGEEVKRYFAYAGWAYYKKKGKWISLVKSIYNEMGYEIEYKRKKNKNGKKTEYRISKKNL